MHFLIVDPENCRDLIESLMGAGNEATHVNVYEGKAPAKEELVAAFFKNGDDDTTSKEDLTFLRLAWTQLTSELLATVDIVILAGDRLLGWHARGETIDVTGTELALELRTQHGYTGQIFFYSSDPAIARQMIDEAGASYLEPLIARHALTQAVFSTTP